MGILPRRNLPFLSMFRIVFEGVFLEQLSLGQQPAIAFELSSIIIIP